MGYTFDPLLFSGLVPVTPPSAVPTVPTVGSLPVTAPDGSLYITIDTGDIYEFRTGFGWQIVGGPGAMLGIGPIDSQPPSADGAVDANNALVMQSASATVPGLVNLTTQVFAGDKTFNGNVIVEQDFTVNGTTTTINTQTLNVEDANITINFGGNDATAEGAGITIARNPSTDGSFIFDSTSATDFKIGLAGSEVSVVDESTAQTLTNKSIDADNNIITNIDNNEIKALAGIDATKIADGSVDNTEYQYLDGVTSPIQTQLDDKASVRLDNLDPGNAVNTDLNLNTHLINNVVDPVSPQDAATKNYVDTHPTLAAGSPGAVQFSDGSGTFLANNNNFFWDNSTDRLAISTNNNSPVGKLSVYNLISEAVIPAIALRIADSPTFGFDIYQETGAGGDFTIDRVVAGTSSEAFRIDRATGDITVQGQIHNVTDPTSLQDAATKAYVDSVIAGGANTALSNLSSTAINQSLIFGVAIPGLLKTNDRNDGADLSEALAIRTGDTAANAATGALTVRSGTSTINASGAVFVGSGDSQSATGNTSILTGDSPGGSSGSVILKTGTAAGTRGTLKFNDGSEGTAGHVWTSTDTLGNGHWAAASGGSGANTALSNLDATTMINSSLLPGVDNSIDLGSSSFNWQTGYIQNLKDSSGNLIIDIQGKTLNDNLGNPIVDFSGAGAVLTVFDPGLQFNNVSPSVISTIDGTSSSGIALQTGVGTSAASGDVTIQSGGSLASNSGSVFLITGAGAPNWQSGNLIGITSPSTGTAVSGVIEFDTGATEDGNSGAININTGNTTGLGNSGTINLTSGSASGTTSNAGDITLIGGNSVDGITGGINLFSGNASGTGNSAAVQLISGAVNDGTSGDAVLFSGASNGTGVTGNAVIKSGDAGGPGTATTGDVILHTGTTTGTRGKIKFEDGTEGTAGYVWTSTDTLGHGAWQVSGAGGSTFSDSAFRIQDNSDATKQLAFEVSGIATGTTRTITVPNANINLDASTPGTGTFANAQLSNLGTTSINANLNPAGSNSLQLGNSNQWLTVNSLRHISTFSTEFAVSGLLTGLGFGPTGMGLASSSPPTNPFNFATADDGASNATATQDILIKTGNKIAGTGNGGNVNLTAGTSAGGTPGRILMNSATQWPSTVTAIGTTGAQTINKPSGTVNIATAGTSVVVTNNLVTANSIVFAVLRTNDASATIQNVVPAAGSFTITLGAAATGTVSIGFFVINQ